MGCFNSSLKCAIGINIKHLLTIIPLSVLDGKLIATIDASATAPVPSTNPVRVNGILPANTVVFKESHYSWCCTRPSSAKYFVRVENVIFEVDLDSELNEADVLKSVPKTKGEKTLSMCNNQLCC
jgi:hypothetical protein